LYAFDKKTFLIDALTKERDRLTREINELIADVEAGRAFPDRFNGEAEERTSTSASPSQSPPGTPPVPSREEAPTAEDESAATSEEEASPEEEPGDEGPIPEHARYHGRSRDAFDRRKRLAFGAVTEGGGEVPFSSVLEAFESVGLTERLARSALGSLRKAKRLYNVKRANPSNNTWALWDHPNAIAARRRDGGEDVEPNEPRHELGKL
jgi:hypothetical protein